MIKFKNEEYDEVTEGKLKKGDIVKSVTANGTRIFEIDKVSSATGFSKINDNVTQKFTSDINEEFRKIPLVKEDVDISYKIYRKIETPPKMKFRIKLK